MSDSTLPTIAVKKSDGSIVKMTLEEFRAYKSQMKSGGAVQDTPQGDIAQPQGTPLKPNVVVKPNVAPDPVQESTPENLPMVEQSQELTTSTPTIVGNQARENAEEKVSVPPPPVPLKKNYIKPAAPVSGPPPLSKEDFVSLLEEETQSNHHAVSGTNEKMTQDIMSALPFALDKNIQGRLQSLIVSRLKEIRTDAQVQESAALSVEGGGLGFDPNKIQILLQAIQERVQKKSAATPNPSAPMRLNPIAAPAVPAAKKEAVLPREQTITPVKKPDAEKFLSSLIVEDNMQSQLLSKVGGQSKVQMHDVVTPSRAMGPVDEMLGFTLTDFRRLGKTASECASALMQKFTVLKNDTYLLFLNGRAAWFKSPLYQMYLGTLEQSLKMNKPLSAISLQNSKESFTMEEIQEVARVNQSLNF